MCVQYIVHLAISLCVFVRVCVQYIGYKPGGGGGGVGGGGGGGHHCLYCMCKPGGVYKNNLVISRAYEEKRACNSQCILCMRHNTDESAGYAIFSQPPTREIASIGEKKA